MYTKVNLFRSLLAIVFLSFIVYACRKNDRSPAAAQAADQWQSWFDNNVVAAESKFISAAKKVLYKNAPDVRFARMGILAPLLDWDNASQQVYEGKHFTLVPLRENARPFENKAYDGFRLFAFYTDEQGRQQLKVIEVISKKNQSLGTDRINIGKSVFANALLKGKETISGLNAEALVYNDTYHFESGQTYNNGAPAKGNFKLNITPRSRFQGGLMRTYLANSCDGCETIYLVGSWYDINTGEVLGTEVITSYEECQQPGNYGGTPGTGSGNPTPCQQAAAATNNLILNANVSSLATKLSNSYESGIIGLGSNGYQDITGTTTGGEFTFNASQFVGTTALFHTHQDNNSSLTIFSWDDFKTFVQLTGTSGLGCDMTQYQFGVVTYAGTYVLSITNLSQFSNFCYQMNTASTQSLLNTTYAGLVTTNHSYVQNEMGLIDFLNTVQNGSGLALLKYDADAGRYKPLVIDSNGNLAAINCP